MQPKSVLETLKTLMFRLKENSLTYDEFYSFSRHLYICEDPVIYLTINKGLNIKSI